MDLTQTAPILGIYGISFSYNGSAKVIDDLSFEVKKGEFLALYGPNGSGKTTLLKIIAGLLSGGQVHYFGTPLNTLTATERSRRVAYLPSEISIDFPLTAYQAVQLGRSSQGNGFFAKITDEELSMIEKAMKKCHCWQHRDQQMADLSGGERQLVSLARVLVQGAGVLLLDESFSKLDLNHQIEIGSLLRELTSDGYTVVSVTHDLNFASEWATSALLLKKGKRIAHGKIEDIFVSRHMSELYPNTELYFGKNPVTGAPKIFYK
jgi:iron complex transport system ATP-binding protein